MSSGEAREARIKRLRMRSMRRGIKEMDLILVAYAEARLVAMTSPEACIDADKAEDVTLIEAILAAR